MKQFLLNCVLALLLLASPGVFAQVTVTSSDSLTCFLHCTTLTAHVIGDRPTNSGITIDDYFQTTPDPIGFTFNFYGVPYTTCLIGPNGNICFDAALAGAYTDWVISGPLAGTATVRNSICGPWCDMDIVFGGSITYSLDGVAPNRKYVITYCRTGMYSSSSCPGEFTTSQVILYEGSNIVEVHIAHKTVCTAWNSGRAICGVQNAAGTVSTVAPGRDWTPTWGATDEAWRYTPMSGGTTYSVTSIPFAPVPYDTSSIYWYNVTTGAYLGTGPTIYVCPTVPTVYRACALGCSDTSSGYYTVSPAGTLVIGVAITDPSHCSDKDGSITVRGLTPGMIDTIYYNLGGVPQPPFIATVSATGTIVIPNLCAALTDVGYSAEPRDRLRQGLKGRAIRAGEGPDTSGSGA